MRGFIVSDWLDKLGDFQREAGELFVAGKLKHRETLVEGIENAADAFLGLFKGANIGKMVVKLGR
jgi:NADPH-dependent curcumin reductase CurA